VGSELATATSSRTGASRSSIGVDREQLGRQLPPRGGRASRAAAGSLDGGTMCPRAPRARRIPGICANGSTSPKQVDGPSSARVRSPACLRADVHPSESDQVDVLRVAARGRGPRRPARNWSSFEELEPVAILAREPLETFDGGEAKHSARRSARRPHPATLKTGQVKGGLRCSNSEVGCHALRLAQRSCGRGLRITGSASRHPTGRSSAER